MTAAQDAPCSKRQAGAVHGQLRRLGLGDPAWRGCRLAVAGVLTGRPGLPSIRALSGGEAGYLLRLLASCRDARDLAVVTAWSVEDAQREAASRAG